MESIEFTVAIRLALVGVNAIGVWLAILLNVYRSKSRIAFLFTAMVVLMLFWVNFAYLSRILPTKQGIIFIRFAWAITPLYFVTIFLFISEFFGKTAKIYSLLKHTLLIVAMIEVPIIILTPLVIKNIYYAQAGIVRIVYGGGVWIFFGTIFFLTLLNLFVLTKEYFGVKAALRKRQIEYILTGFSLFFLANAIFNIVFPVFLDIFHLYRFGDYSNIILVSFIAYAILKSELLGIRIFLTALLMGFIGVLLFLDLLLFTPLLWLQAMKGFTLILLIYFSYLLVKSIRREIQQREQLEALTKKLEAANAELKRLDQAKSEFVSIASHQLRTPLTAIKGYLSLALGGSYGKIPENVKKPMAKVYESNERLIRLVNDLLSLSRIESGKMELELQRADLAEIIQSVVDELQVKARQKDLKLAFQKPATALPPSWLDKEKIRNVILNIVDNAIRYTGEGSITISLAQENKAFQIRVRDTGEGMTQEEIAKLFESFSRGQAGQKLATEGAGLGLYIAQQFVQMHGGRIWAESSGKGKGSTFFVEIPVKSQTISPPQRERITKFIGGF